MQPHTNSLKSGGFPTHFIHSSIEFEICISRFQTNYFSLDRVTEIRQISFSVKHATYISESVVLNHVNLS